jgi:hypothetical protein
MLACIAPHTNRSAADLLAYFIELRLLLGELYTRSGTMQYDRGHNRTVNANGNCDHSYRNASAGKTRVADQLGYKVAMKEIPMATAATSTPSRILGEKGT